MSRKLRLIILLALSVATGVVVSRFSGPRSYLPIEWQRVLEQADGFELLSLDPVKVEDESTDGFHEWPVLGKTSIANRADRERLVSAIIHGATIKTGLAPACFRPRHGIRITNRTETVDFVICFECSIVVVHVGDRSDSFPIKNMSVAFDTILKRMNIPLAVKP